MSDKVISETPATETPSIPQAIVETPKEVAKSPGEKVQSAREQIEDSITTSVDAASETKLTSSEETKAPASIEAQPEAAPVETSIEDKVKAKIQKRIDKEVAKRKTLEEQLAEKEAEIAALKAQSSKPAEIAADPKREPTDAEIRAALIKAKQDGDVEFEVQILEYMAERKAKAEREAAMKDIEARESTQKAVTTKQQADWVQLNRDFMVYDDSGKPDMKHDMSLSNQEGILYRTAMELYQDPELKRSLYNDTDTIQGFRRAVNDAYREIYSNGLLKGGAPKPSSGEGLPSNPVTPKRAPLAEPGSESSEDMAPSPKNLSDTEKVIEEIHERTKLQQSKRLR